MSAISADCELSVIVAAGDSDRAIIRALEALSAACEGMRAEIIVADGSGGSVAPLVRAFFPVVSVVLCQPDTPAPMLWDAGLRRARGRHVAFTLAECEVERSWARSLVAALESGAAGAGGVFTLPRDADAVQRAVFFLRYSAFLEGSEGRRDDIAGDNSCYRRDVLERFHDRQAGGFWEVELHRKLRQAGERLVLVRGAAAALVAAPAFQRLALARFTHGRRFAAWRVRAERRSPWKIVAGAPLVPAVMTARIGRRAWRRWGDGWRFVSALPLLVPLASCWAAGEAVGAFGTMAGRRPGEVTA